ncbi:cyclic peptide export ABC transporter [Tistrella bauzanensis]|uniref:Cyclic peptide export ABC transporter n=1 Tax=Tistrella arctica TaxID=3133430 RepID=A0ABU9YPX1_9PROT
MPLIDLIRREMTTKPMTMLVIAALAGVSNALVMAIINTSSSLADEKVDLRTVALFGIVVAIYILSQRRMMQITAIEVEEIIHRLRRGLIETVARSDLLPLEQIGRSNILAGLIRDTQTISQAANILVIAAQSVILIALAMIYILITDRTAFWLSTGFIAIAVFLVVRRLIDLRNKYPMAMGKENLVFQSMRDVLDGFKEVKLSAARRDALLEDMVVVSELARDAKADLQVKSGNEFVFGQTMIFLLLGVVVFLVPSIGDTKPEAVVQTATAILFIVGPLGMVIQAVPVLAMANAAADNLSRMDQTLREIAAASATATTTAVTPLTQFDEIRFDGITFAYAPVGGVAFGVGPFDLTVRQGETIFITGGNGSGKSTLVRLLVGLYYPDRGMLRLNGQVVDRHFYDSYRSLFSVIYADYHLFRRLYGITPPSAEEFQALVTLMEMGGKVALDKDVFDTIDLSSGQRKRLALMVSMIEDRPILVLDEWAADQDPQFRRKFYRELLPLLKARGKTVIAITHDDRYFDVADRRIAMEEGRVVAIVEREAATGGEDVE